MTPMGEGSLNTLVRVYPPWRVRAELDAFRERGTAYWFWDSHGIPFGQH